jgi:hypothetical protein
MVPFIPISKRAVFPSPELHARIVFSPCISLEFLKAPGLVSPSLYFGIGSATASFSASLAAYERSNRPRAYKRSEEDNY